MPNLEFEVEHQIVSPFGTLNMNVADPDTGYLYKVLSDNYKIVPGMRVTQDNVSQQDGSVLHPSYKTGLVATMTVQYSISNDGGTVNFTYACESQLRLMHEALILHLNALRKDSANPNTEQRLVWYPTGLGEARMLTGVQLLTWTDPQWQDPGWTVTYSLFCEFPYAIDATEIDTTVNSGGSALIPNAGNAEFFPVIEVASGPSSFTITNTDSGETVVYDGAAIGGTAAELVFFDGTIYVDGDSTDLIAGITPTTTDWFTIKPNGGTNVSISGADMTVKSNNAYA